MQNPFSTTFSKYPENTYISTSEPAEMIENFSYDSPSEAVYKITGLRGSGKTVIMANVHDELSSDLNKKRGWLVYTLNPARDMLRQLAGYLYAEKFIKDNAGLTGLNISASVLGTGAGIGLSRESAANYFDIGVEIRKMLDIIKRKNKKILICIDEVAKTPDMVVFALEFGGWLISGYPTYLVCTGLYKRLRCSSYSRLGDLCAC